MIAKVLWSTTTAVRLETETSAVITMVSANQENEKCNLLFSILLQTNFGYLSKIRILVVERNWTIV